MDDWTLLREYLERGSEGAFGELMNRHLDLVYGAARRRLGDGQAAEDVAQHVFCLLARKAGRLDRRVSLAGWLYQTAFYMASKQSHSDQRRQRRERAAAEMRDEADAASASWERIAPALDESMSRLAPHEREVLLLRFFQRTPLQELGRRLGVSEDAARMRVHRSLDKLRSLLQARGVASSAAALAAMLAEEAARATPADAATAIRAAVLPQLSRFVVPASGSTLFETMKTYPMKSALIVGTACLLGFVGILHSYNRTHDHTPRAEAPPQFSARDETIHPLTPAAAGAPENRPTRHAAAPAGDKAPFQVHLAGKFVEVAGEAAGSLPQLSGKDYQVTLLSDPEFRDLVASLEQQAGVDVMSCPNVTTVSERQAQISTTVTRQALRAQGAVERRTNCWGSPLVTDIVYEPVGVGAPAETFVVPTGIVLDLIPSVESDHRLRLTFIPSITAFLGYRPPAVLAGNTASNAPAASTNEVVPVPWLRVLASTNQTQLASGQTVLCGPFYQEETRRTRDLKASVAAALAEQGADDDALTNLPPEAYDYSVFSVPKRTYVFITATVVDPAGERLPQPTAESTRMEPARPVAAAHTAGETR